MAKARIPVSVAGIEFDALISSDYSMESTVPEYAVESGFNVTDAIILKPEKLSMVLYITDTPVTWSSHGNNRCNSVVSQLESLYYTKTPVTVVTSDMTYTNMAIESMTVSKSLEIGYAREVPITFRKVRITGSSTTGIPSSYGKSGSSGTTAGTASTTTGSSSSSSGSSSSGSSSSGSGSSSSGSVLYNAGKSTGIIK